MGRFHQLKLMYTSLPSAESEDSQLYSNMSPFRTMERRFKRIYLGDGLDNKALLLKHPILKSFIEPSLAPICLTAENKEDNKEEVDDEGCQTDGGGGVKIVQVKGSLEHLCRDFGDKCRQETSEWWCRQCNHETAQIEEGEEEESSLTTDVITFDGHPGLIVIRNAFSPKAQRNVIRACLREYTRSPNYTSLSKWYSTPSNPWDLYEEWRKEAELFENDNTNVPQRNSKKFERPSFHSDCTVKLRDSKFMLQLSNLTVKLQQNQTVSSPTSSSSSNFATTAPPALSPISASTCNLEQGCSTTTARACTLAIPKSPYDSPSIPFSTPPQLKPIPISTAIRKCRWTNLGLLYDWTHKMYTPTPTNEPLLHPHHPLQVPPMVNPPVPPLISRLVKAVIKLTSCLTGYDADRFECEGGIVNFYGIKDTLMAHQDRSEPNKTAPLVSFSFGHSCVFLIGTSDRDSIPTPIIVNSGDVLVMSGESRRAFHGVPRILQNTLPSFLHPSERTWKRYQKCRSEAVVLSSRYNFAPRVDWDEWRREMEEEKRDWDIYGEYMLESRINLNIRQVNS